MLFSCHNKDFSRASFFIFKASEGEPPHPVEGGAAHTGPRTAQDVLKSSENILARFDRYKENWPKGDDLTKAQLPDGGRFKGGEEQLVTGDHVRIRSVDGGFREASANKGTPVIVAEPVVRIQVQDKVFVAIYFGDKTSFIAEEYLETPGDIMTRNEHEVPQVHDTPAENASPVKEYFAGNEAMQENYERLRSGILTSLKGLEQKAAGTKIEAFAHQLVRDFSENFDSTMLALFHSIDLQNDPVVIGRMLQNAIVPQFELTSDLPPNVGAEAMPSHNPPLIVINRDFAGTDYPTFQQVVVHESLHIYMEGFGEKSYVQGRIGEGITQLLAEKATDFASQEIGYGDEKAVAAKLFQVDPHALMAWYTGALDDAAYMAQLRQKMDHKAVEALFALSQERANVLPQLQKILDFAAGDSSSPHYSFLKTNFLQYMSGEIDDDGLSKAIQASIDDTQKRVDVFNQIWGIKNAFAAQETQAYKQFT